MIIKKYFDGIKDVIDRYSATHFLISTNVNFDIRPGEQGYLKGIINFTNNSSFHFKEFLDAVNNNVDKLMYVYHYQDVNNQLVFRYDNALHKPKLPFIEHKHIPEQITQTHVPVLADVFEEIFKSNNWV